MNSTVSTVADEDSDVRRALMDINSKEESSDISESDIDDYKKKPFEQLRAGNYKVKNLNGTLRCPFCAGKKKQDYKYTELLQHASGVGKGSANRTAKQKANHLALAKYLETDLSGEADQVQGPSLPQPFFQHQQDDLYVWPWTGIVVDIQDKSLHHSRYWLKKLAKYWPLDVHIFKENDVTAQAVVKFSDDWSGFLNTRDFDKSFGTKHCGKTDWELQNMKPDSRIHGWIAREDDYHCEGPIGKYLRKKGSLKRVSDIVHEASKSRRSDVAKLANEIDVTNENLAKMQYRFNEKTMSLSRMLEEKDQLHHAFLEEIKHMEQRVAKESRRISDEKKHLNRELEARKRKLDLWSRDLNKKKALTEKEKQKLEEDKRMKNLGIESLQKGFYGEEES
ncbi:factor of DNA methylation 5-like isoform X1 [Prosopis cineraria]|uniref:factor of DNA methylation 5-like isoform X1 n=1 Tax=Prosopis cineraria TaxID=364024 RepID=UPI00240EBF58|nr:factor of DNA methylation 5-like isoform X1 [Prosopis cineraria]